MTDQAPPGSVSEIPATKTPGAQSAVGAASVRRRRRFPLVWLVPIATALIAGWLRGQANAAARVQVRVYAADHDVDTALARGRALRAAIDEAADPIGVLVVADGANTLTQGAPGGYDPDSEPVQNALDDALANGNAAALTRLPNGIVGRVAYQVLAGLTEPNPHGANELVRGAPYGVGYFVGTWTPGG